jgi:hypothetical protein
MKKIDTKISQSLFALPIPGAAGSGSNVLAFRNMVRGKHYGLPAGEDVAREMKGSPVHPEGLGSGFASGTPLWYWILDESGRQGGQRLGDIGARIVAEVFLANLKRDKESYLNAERSFQPSVPHQGEFTMGDFLRFAGVA